VNWLEGNVARAESSVDISSFTQSHNHTTLAHVGILRINDERQSVLINCTDISQLSIKHLQALICFPGSGIYSPAALGAM